MDSAKKSKKIRIPQQQRSIETKNRILDAALYLFSEKGFHATNSKEIAAAAGVSIGSFYCYFEEKEPLFLEILRRYSERVINEMIQFFTTRISQETDARKIIPLIINALLAAHNLSPKFHRESIALRYTNPEVQKIFDQEEAQVVNFLTTILQSQAAHIKVKDFEAAAIVIRHSAEEVIHSIKIFGSPLEEQRIISELNDMISRYLF
jgi:AcrR family transcriptional regulator